MKLCLKCNARHASPEWLCPECGHAPSLLNGFVAHSEEMAQSGGGGFKPEIFEQFNQWELSSFWWRARRDIITWAIKKFKNESGNVSFLEVGCAAGYLLGSISAEFPNINLSGAEIFLDGLQHAAKRLPNVTFMQMDARKIPFADEFDMIGIFDVLEHIEEDEDVLRQLYRALKPGGTLLLIVPQHQWLWSNIDDHVCHVRRYKAKDLHGKMLAQNFILERSTSFVSLLFPAMVASRMKSKLAKGNDDLASEMQLPRVVNEVFYKVMRTEKKLIDWGLNFPFGGSRLVVAKKAFAS